MTLSGRHIHTANVLSKSLVTCSDLRSHYKEISITQSPFMILKSQDDVWAYKVQLISRTWYTPRPPPTPPPQPLPPPLPSPQPSPLNSIKYFSKWLSDTSNSKNPYVQLRWLHFNLIPRDLFDLYPGRRIDHPGNEVVYIFRNSWTNSISLIICKTRHIA